MASKWGSSEVWEKAVAEYNATGQTSAGGGSAGWGNSSAWQTAVAEYNTLGPDGFKDLLNKKKKDKEFSNSVSRFFNDVNTFRSSANRDLSENQFNAADYFEERKKQADALKQRAAALSLYLEDNADAYTPESYDSLMQTLSTFDTEVDDVLSLYQPALDSRAGMRAYEDEMIAAMERNEQLRKNQQAAVFGIDPTNMSMGFFDKFQKYTDDSHRAVTDQWTDADRFELGLRQMESPEAAAQFASDVNSYYNYKATEPERQQIRQQATDNIWKNTGKALLGSTFTAQNEFLDRMAEHAARGQITEKNYLTPWDRAQETTSAISENLNQNAIGSDKYNEISGMMQEGLRGSGADAFYTDINTDPVTKMFEGKGFGDLYNMGYSMAQNTLSRFSYGMVPVAGEALTLANYFASAATSGIDEARRKGANSDQAVTSGILKGIWEVGTEVLGLDNLYKMGPAVTWGELIKQLGIQGAFEGVGEGVNAALGYLSDVAVLGDLSEYQETVQRYIDQGETEERAKWLAFQDAAKNVGFEALAGAASGWISGGTEAAYKTGSANLAYRNVDPQRLIDEGMKTDEGSSAFRRAMAMQEALNNQQKISANDKRVLGQTTLQQLAAAKVEAEAQATEEQQPSESAAPEAPAENRSAIQISTKNPIDVLDFDSIDGKNATLQLKDGGTVDYDDVNFADQQQANQFYTVRSLPGLDTEAANDLLHTIQEADAAKDIDSVVGIRDAYRIGYFNQAESDLAKSDSAVLSPQLRKAVFDIGRKASQVQAAVQRSAKVVTAKPTGKYKKIVLENPGMKITTKRRAELDYVDKVAAAFAGTTVHVFESYKKGDSYYFKDINGKEHEAPNGKYVNGEIWLDINAGDKDGLILHTFAHEMYHHIETWNKTKANELASFVAKELGIENVDKAVADQIEKARAAGYGEEHFISQGKSETEAQNEVYARAMSDFVADSLETMFTRGNPAEAIARLHSEDKDIFDKLKKFIDKWISHVKAFYKDKTISQEGAAVAQLKNFEELQRLFMEAMKGAGENYKEALDAVIAENATPVDSDAIQTDGAFVTDGEEMFSIKSMKQDIAEGQMFEDLKTYCNWTQKQVDSLRNQLKDLVDYMTPFRDILDLNETYGREGRRFSPYKPNSDPLYKISMDFSTLCSKRLLTQYVIENLQLRENRPMSAEEQMAIRDMLNEYRKKEKGLQVACAMCYVEAARLKSPNQMQKWMSDPETYMRNYFADKDPDFAAYIKGKQEDFKESRGYARNTPKKEMNSKDVTALNKIRPRLRAEYQPSSGEMAIIEKAKSLPNSTYLTAANLANLSESDPTIYAAYTAFVRTATRSKSLETDEPYYYGDSRRDNGNGIVVTDAFIEEVNRENGMRFSSWSDWLIQHMLDYITAVIDNSVRGAAMHGYTKFPEEVRVLGKTGMMFNMSGVAGTQTGLNDDGSLSFSETESINKDDAVQLREEFPETAGLQCIGVSDAHIKELLKSNIIDYVIPYHISGLNKGLRSMANIQGWKDYTSTQHAAVDKNAKKPDGADKWHEEPVFSEFFVGYDTGMTGIEAMRASADRYKQMCAERGLKPKFEQFAKEPNYWKLLIDRKMINQKTGNLIQQKPVTPTFDFDTIKTIVDRHVANYDSNMEARALNHIVENWDSIPKRIRDLKKQGGKKTVKKSIDNLSNQTLAAQPTDGNFSHRNQKPPTVREILMGVDISKRNKAEQYHLGAYQERVELLAEEQPKLEALQARIKVLEADGKRHPELTDLRNQERKLRYSVQGLKRAINNAERYDMFRRIVAEERKKLQEQQSRDNLKAYKQEQREKVEAMQTEQKVLRAQLKNTDDFATVMGEELAKIAKDYEAQKIDLKTKDEQIRRLERQYSAAKARIERNKESQSVQKQRKHVEEKSKALMKMLTNPTKDAHVPMELQESLREFLNSIDFTSVRKSKGGAATVRDIAYTNALEDLRRAVAAQRSVFEKEDGTFKLDVPPEFMEKIDDHIKTIKAATKGLDLNTNRVYEMSGAELKDLSYLLGVINKAIREIDKFHLQGEKARTSGYAQETVQEMSTRKPVNGEEGNKYLWGNSTPWYAFRRYGKAGQRIFKGLMQGQAKLARNTDSIVKFAENTYTSKEVREWERERHTIKLDSGKTVTMSTAQIMSFWCLSRRDQAIPHMQGGGMRLTALKKSMEGTSVQNEVVQKEHFTLTLEDVNRINNLLTERQQEVAGKLQQFMQTVGGRFINEISMARWDFMAATETDYFPIQTEDTGRDAKNPDQDRTSLFALLNKSFTKAPMKNAKNALVVDSIFNVFANHMSETAEYNAFALPLVDAMKWFNYKERIDIGEGHIKDVSVQKAIEDTLGKNARRYFIDLMTDINSSQKAGRHEDFFGKILGRSKVSSVAWNTRVAIQQLSALPRASMVLKPRYLLSGASKFRLQYAVKEMQKYSGIALWKSMGYYDLNVARSVEQQIKHDTSLLDQFNEMGMWLPGKMDERTWARIWIATREQIRNDRKLSGEELLQATADLFEDVVYQTQVADSVLTRSSFMRSKSQIIKEATSFMAEPTLSTNILMYAFEDYEAGHTTWEKTKRGLTIGFTGYALSAVANALLGSLADAWRDDDEYETFWEKYLEALLGNKEKLLDGNLFSELNPLEKFIFVKDFLSVAKGFEPHSSYSKLISSGKDLLNAYQSAMESKGSKTTYGIVYQTLQYLSTLSGTALGNMTREVEDLWNNTFGKEYPDLRLEKYKPDNGDELLQAIQKGTEEDIQRVFGRFENQQKAESALQSAIGEQYRSGQLSAEEAEQLLTDYFEREDEHEVYWLFDKWDYARENGSSDSWKKYGKFLEGIESGDFQSEMERLLEHGAEASDIQSQITRTYRKKYLENPDDREEIQEKVQAVYKATGMHDDEILEKFKDWDFEAEYGMTYGEMKGEFRDGNVTENELRQAMKFYGQKNYQIEEDIRNLKQEIKFYDKYDMSLSEMKDAYDRGDVSRNTMIGAQVFNGMTKKEAQEWVNQRDISNSIGIDFMELDDAYKYGDISRTTLRNAIIKNGETPEKVDEAMMGYDWLKKNVKRYPDLAISDAKKFAVRIHSDYAPDETLEDYGVTIDAYIEYQRLRPECKGVDANGDGKTDDGTLRDSIFRMIDSLPISSEAKDGLALMSYSAKSIRRNAPWH